MTIYYATIRRQQELIVRSCAARHPQPAGARDAGPFFTLEDW
jgi:hypothetical protein